MSILTKVTTGRRGRAQKVVIYAPEGFGKSTLAGRFPNPLFLDVEDSTSQLDVRRLSRSEIPDLKTFETALAEVSLAVCGTLVVDTIDWLEQMATDAMIVEANNPKITGIEDFGYGKGYTALRERVTILLAKFDAIISRGVTVVLLAHSKVSKFEPPDGAGPYDRYELKLSKQVAPLIKEWADMLLFGNWRTQIREKDKNEAGAQFKGVGGKDRVLYCNRTASWDAKNRHGLSDTEKWEISVIEKAFRDVGAPWGNVETPAAVEMPKPQTPASAAEPRPVQPDENFHCNPDPAPVAAETTQPPAGSSAPADQLPGLSATEGQAPAVDAELERICAPHSDSITAYLIANKKIQAGQTWKNMTEDFAKRVKKNPAGFLKVAVKTEGVAA